MAVKDIPSEVKEKSINFSQGGIFFILILNSIILTIAILFYCICLKRFLLYKISSGETTIREVKKKKSRFNELPPSDEEEHEQNQKKKRKKSLSILANWRIFYKWIFSEDFYLSFGAKYGYQAAIYLYFLKQLACGLFICAIIGLPVLLPLHLTGVAPKPQVREIQTWKYTEKDYWLIKTTISMVSSDPLKMYVHVVLCYIFVLIFIVMMHQFSRSKIVKMYPYNHFLASDVTALLRHLPKTLTSNSLLQQAVSLPRVFGKKVKDVHLFYKSAPFLKISKRLENLQDLYDEAGPNDRLRRGFLWCRRVHAKTYYSVEMEKLKKKLEHMQPPHDMGSGLAFVQFSSIEGLHNELERTEHGLIDYHVHIEGAPASLPFKDISFSSSQAPEPTDIIWQNYHYSTASRSARSLIVNVVIFIYMFLFTTPVALLYALQNFQSYILKIEDLNKYLSAIKNNVLVDLIYQYLPTIMLLIVTSGVPLIIPYFAAFEKFPTYSTQEITTTIRLFIYLILTTLILPTLTLTSVDGIKKFMHFDSLTDTLSSVYLPGSGIFFVNYSIQYLFWGHVVDILRLGELFQYVIYRIKGSKKEAARELAHCDLSIEYGWWMSLFALVLSYSIFTPLFLVLGFLYFVTKYWVDYNNFITVWAKTPASPHRTIPDRSTFSSKIILQVALVFASIIIFEGFMILYFLKTPDQCYIHIILLCVLCFCTFVYISFWYYHFATSFSSPSSTMPPVTSSQVPLMDDSTLDEDDDEDLIDESAQYHIEKKPTENTSSFKLIYQPPNMPMLTSLPTDPFVSQIANNELLLHDDDESSN